MKKTWGNMRKGGLNGRTSLQGSENFAGRAE